MADAQMPAPPARLSRGRASVVGGRLVLIVALITGMALVASVALLPLVVPAGGLARDTVDKLGDVPPLEQALPDPAQRSVIYAADGKTALATLWLDENRRVAPLKDVPKRVRNAVIAIEDSSFYQHEGVDFRGIARAAVADIRTRRIAQGGSTLTQQLVKQTITGNSRTLDRKLREAMYAVDLERRSTTSATRRSSTFPWPRRRRWPGPSTPPSATSRPPARPTSCGATWSWTGCRSSAWPPPGRWPRPRRPRSR
jgi:membrane peptidoglycan carboxypeptidase